MVTNLCPLVAGEGASSRHNLLLVVGGAVLLAALGFVLVRTRLGESDAM